MRQEGWFYWRHSHTNEHHCYSYHCLPNSLSLQANLTCDFQQKLGHLYQMLHLQNGLGLQQCQLQWQQKSEAGVLQVNEIFHGLRSFHLFVIPRDLLGHQLNQSQSVWYLRIFSRVKVFCFLILQKSNPHYYYQQPQS